MHHWGPTANSQNTKGAPLGSHSGFTEPQGCTIGVPPRIHKTPRVHNWGHTANSQNPKGAPLWSHREFTKPKGEPLASLREFTKPQGCNIGVPPRIHRTPRVPQDCTIGVPPRIHKTPRVHNWGPTANSQNPKGRAKNNFRTWLDICPANGHFSGHRSILVGHNKNCL